MPRPPLDDDALTTYQWAVLEDVATHGALTTRRLVATHGPRVTWHRLVAHGWLKAVKTMYGEVVGLTAEAQAHRVMRGLKSALGEEALPSLSAPSTLADRAFQADALRQLLSEDYWILHVSHRRGAGVGRPRADAERNQATGQITSVLLLPPPLVSRQIEARWGPTPAFTPAHLYEPVPGHAVLVASVANGGLTGHRLRALLREYDSRITTWKHPLIVALPQGHDLHGTLRRVAAEYADPHTGRSGVWDGWDYLSDPRTRRFPRLRVLTLPLG